MDIKINYEIIIICLFLLVINTSLIFIIITIIEIIIQKNILLKYKIYIILCINILLTIFLFKNYFHVF
jgi:hypothetical protein